VLDRYQVVRDPWKDIGGSPATLDALLDLASALGPAEKPPKGTGRRQLTRPLIEIARAKTRAEALDGLERWKTRHQSAVSHLEAADILVDAMRGRSSVWHRIRINLQHVQESQRPPQEPLEVDYDPWTSSG
jgi:bifunctional non-homologous end joining protein LigD